MKQFLTKMGIFLGAAALLLVNTVSFTSDTASSSSNASNLPPGSYLKNCKNCAVKSYSNGYQLTCECETGKTTGGFLGFGATPVYAETSIAISDIANNKGVLEAVPFKKPLTGPSIPIFGPFA